MKIIFSTSDDFLEGVKQKFFSKFKYKTKHHYRIFGVSSLPSRPAVVLYITHEQADMPQYNVVKDFLRDNSLTFTEETYADARPCIHIGIKRNIRENEEFCSRLVHTMIGFFEGKYTGRFIISKEHIPANVLSDKAAYVEEIPF